MNVAPPTIYLSTSSSSHNATTIAPRPVTMHLATPMATPITTVSAQPVTMRLATAIATAIATAQPALTVQPLTMNLAQPLTMNLAEPDPTTTLALRVDPQPNAVAKDTRSIADIYKQYDQRTHVYMKPDMYIGSDERVVREEWLYDLEAQKMVNSTIDFTPGCERLYLEILTNASDNVGASRREGIDPGRIEILMDNSTISITNYGKRMPVEIHVEKGIYVPQMLFGYVLTSSNYEVERHGAGTNGIGAKATNIFSNMFMVIVQDSVVHRKYTQVWNTNMTVRGEPIIEEYKGNVSSVQIVYAMDFARFKYPVPNGTDGGYPPEAFALFARHAADISFTAKVVVTFNGQEFNFSNIRNYAKLYFGDAVDSAIVHYQWPPGTEVVKKKKGYQVARNPKFTSEIELIAIDTPDEGRHVSFVNCMMTRDGGVHVNAAIKAVGDSAVKMINENVLKRLTKQNKGKELDAKEKRSHTITINDVKPHISILLAARVRDPKFTSQTKTVLASPVPKIEVSEDELKSLNHWQLIDRLHAALEAKQFASLAKTDGKLRRYVRLVKGVDANEAGKADRHKCVLYVTEGDSGSGYANVLLGLVPGGRDYVGVLPMKGKSLNVMNADKFQIEKNREIKELQQMLGLEYCVDNRLRETYYLDPKNFSRLRYGALMIMADSDVDGKHIIGLILNLFYCRFPSLLARGFVMYYRTPIISVVSNRTKLKFYNQREYDEWKVTMPNVKSLEHKYYKGLGSSTPAEVAEDYVTPRVVSCYYDEDAPAAMKLAFHKDLADQRKDWVGNWRPMQGADEVAVQPISWFVNHELIIFSIADTKRSIPKLTDGLKESQRKVIHAAHLKWTIGAKSKYKRYKVAQFSGFIADKTNYHHGETILYDVIIGMAQDFTGSNNIPWFFRDGIFGTRVKGGKDHASARYLHTLPDRLFSYILRKEDQPTMKYLTDEGTDIEPETYFPTVPMILINGGQGIGTGYSTFIPCHNPLDVINWLRMKLNGAADKDLAYILPWYRGFQGTIKVIDRRRKKKNSVAVTLISNVDINGLVPPNVEKTEAADEVEPEDEALPGEEYDGSEMHDGYRPLLSMVTMGKFHLDLKGTIFVTELPIGRWAYDYHKWLEDLVEKRKITGFRDNSNENLVYFEIYGFTEPANHRTLKLRRTFGMSNMVLLDEDDRPVRYDTAFDILEAFYSRRLPIYQKRKEHIISSLTSEILTLNHKIRYIQGVISKEIRLIDRNESTIYEAMDRLGIPHEIYNKGKQRNLSKEGIATLMGQIASKEAERATMEQTSPERIWLRDLEKLEDAYRAHYGIKRPIIKLQIGEPVTPQPITLNLKPSTQPRRLVLKAKAPTSA